MKGYRRQTRLRLGLKTLVLMLYGGLLAVAAAIAYSRGTDLYRPLGDWSTEWMIAGPALGLGAGVIIVFASRLLVRRFRWARRLHVFFRNILGQLSSTDIAILAVASAVGEELLFRGALLPWIGLWPQAVLFALLHFVPRRGLMSWVVMALAMGLLFGWLVELTGNLGAPIAAHFIINFLNLRFIVATDLPDPDLEPA